MLYIDGKFGRRRFELDEAGVKALTNAVVAIEANPARTDAFTINESLTLAFRAAQLRSAKLRSELHVPGLRESPRVFGKNSRGDDLRAVVRRTSERVNCGLVVLTTTFVECSDRAILASS